MTWFQLQITRCYITDKKEDNERAAKRICQSEITTNYTTCDSTSSSRSGGSEDFSGRILDDKVTTEDASPGLTPPPQLAPGFNIWRNLTEAFRLFNASKGKETTIDRLEDLITVLENANSTAMCYKMIVKGLDADDTMSEHKKEDIQMKARYLAQAYRIAIEEMPFKTWNDCCRDAIDQVATVLIKNIKNEKILPRWNVEFCKKEIISHQE